MPCQTPQPTVIFTVSSDADFLSYTPDRIPYKDSKLGIFFETEAMMEETLILLRFNCPEPSCDFTGTGWGDLKLHVRAMHGRVIWCV
jgi:E3 ubiquitin-protein ligase ZNF598